MRALNEARLEGSLWNDFDETELGHPELVKKRVGVRKARDIVFGKLNELVSELRADFKTVLEHGAE